MRLVKIKFYVIALVLFLLPAIGLSETQKDILQIAGEIKKDNLRNTIDKLEKFRERSSWENQDRAVTWATEEFKKIKINTWTETYENKGKTWRNCFAIIKGTKDPSSFIMVTAHIDSISRSGEPAPGADDNGSGVAALFECARLLQKYPPKKSVQFCIFTNEEQGQRGSKAFSKKTKAKGTNIHSVINIDAIGYNKVIAPSFLHAFLGNNSYRNRVKLVVRAIQNCYYRASIGRNAILVGGKPANANLVRIVGGTMKQVAGITIAERTGEECY